MSLYNDYNIQIFHDEKLAGFRADAANDRLARMANGARQPWWRRLLDGPKRPSQDRAPMGVPIPGYATAEYRRANITRDESQVC